VALSVAAWEAELASHLGYPVRVEFTRARRYPVQLRPARRAEVVARPELRHGWVVRLHRAFAEAPPEVREALAAWIRAGRRARRACGLLDRWVEETLAALPPPPRRRTSLRTAGEVHDLAALGRSVLEQEFAGEFEGEPGPPDITWGRRGPSRARSRLQLGSYQPAGHLVRIHPVLDQPAVPAWLVRYVLFHEHLHAAIPSETDPATGRTVHHGPRFNARERAYPDHARALAWERLHLSSLLRSARAGRPLRRSTPLTVDPGPRLPFGRRRG
jgi:hypothetical protein